MAAASVALEETARNTHEPILFLGHFVLDVLGVVQAGTREHVHLGDGDEEPPIPAVELPEQIERQHDGGREVLLEEILHVRSGVGGWLQGGRKGYVSDQVPKEAGETWGEVEKHT